MRAEPLLIDKQAVEAELARRSLKEFVRSAWHLVEPETPLSWNWHLDELCEVLEAITRGELRRLILNVPPGTMKSMLVSVLWPAWEWASNPGLRYLTASYSDVNTIRDNRRLRTIATSDWYRRSYNVQLSSDQTAKVRFDTTAKGWRIATSVGGAGTGEHPDRIICLRGDSLILTDRGQIPIERIVRERLPVKVLGSSGRWQNILRYESGPGRPSIEIKTANPGSLVCTEDHPVWVDGRGFVRAVELLGGARGDLYMRAVRERIQPSTGPRGEDGEEFLLPQVSWPVDDRPGSPALDSGRAVLQELREAYRRLRQRTREASVLLSSLSAASWHRLAFAAMPGMRIGVLEPRETALLQQEVLWHRTPVESEGKREWPICGREVGLELRSRIHEEAEAADRAEGRRLLRHLQDAAGDPARSPHRQGQGQPRPHEPGDAVWQVSQERSFASWRQVPFDSARRCETPATVYNIQTDQDHDYFANGLLVHNCDDPLKASASGSMAELDACIDWFDRTISTRIARDPAIILVMQRLHMRDLAGHLLAKGGFEHVLFPMRYTAKGYKCPCHADRPDPRDHRTEEGELLWPERWPEEKVRQEEIDLGPFGAAGQLAQNPVPEGGGLIKREWLPIVDSAPAEARRCRGWDTAATEGGGDWTVGAKLAVTPEGVIYVEHVARAQVGPAGVDSLIRSHAQMDGRVCMVREEQEGGSAGKAVITSRSRKLAGYDYRGVSITGDKTTRGNPFRAQCEAGNVKVVRGDWNAAYIDVMTSFPVGPTDDDWDATSCAYNALVAEEPGEATPAVWGTGRLAGGRR